MQLRRRLLEIVDDVPVNVELRAMLLDGRTRTYGDEDGAIARGDEARLLAVHGAPLPETVRVALRDTDEDWSLLCAVPIPTVTGALREWDWQRAVIMTLGEGDQPIAVRTTAVEIAAVGDADLGHLGELQAEIEAARRYRMVIAAWVGGRPVSFAYSALRTETWFDISVETLPEFRSRGFSRQCAAALIAHERHGGRRPVWGANEDNFASLRVAAALGFRPSDSIWVATPPTVAG